MRKGRLAIVLGVSVAVTVIVCASPILFYSRTLNSPPVTATPETTPVVAYTVNPASPGATPPGTTPPTTAATTPSTTPTADDGFDAVDQATAKFLTRDARWQVPDTLDVDRTTRIGLAVGSGPALDAGIKSLLPSTSPVSAGAVKVGPTVGVTLRADPADAMVTPSDEIKDSTGTDVQMLWTWLVHPLRPTMALLLTADIELPLDNGHVIRNEFALLLQVRRTLSYTARQIFTNWATWSAIGAAAVGALGWLYRRRRRGPPNQQSGAQHPSEPIDEAEPGRPEAEPDRPGPQPAT